MNFVKSSMKVGGKVVTVIGMQGETHEHTIVKQEAIAQEEISRLVAKRKPGQVLFSPKFMDWHDSLPDETNTETAFVWHEDHNDNKFEDYEQSIGE